MLSPPLSRQPRLLGPIGSELSIAAPAFALIGVGTTHSHHRRGRNQRRRLKDSAFLVEGVLVPSASLDEWADSRLSSLALQTLRGDTAALLTNWPLVAKLEAGRLILLDQFARSTAIRSRRILRINIDGRHDLASLDASPSTTRGRGGARSGHNDLGILARSDRPDETCRRRLGVSGTRLRLEPVLAASESPLACASLCNVTPELKNQPITLNSASASEAAARRILVLRSEGTGSSDIEAPSGNPVGNPPPSKSGWLRKRLREATRLSSSGQV